jgi:type IV secretory pathway TrbD component
MANNTYRSINKPMTMLGIDRSFFMACLFGGYLAFVVSDSRLIGLAAAGVLHCLFWWITITEPKLIQIWSRTLRQKQHYDALRHKPWSGVIVRVEEE